MDFFRLDLLSGSASFWGQLVFQFLVVALVVCLLMALINYLLARKEPDEPRPSPHHHRRPRPQAWLSWDILSVRDTSSEDLKLPTPNRVPAPTVDREIGIFKPPCKIEHQNDQIRSLTFEGKLSCMVTSTKDLPLGTSVFVDNRDIGRDLLWVSGILDEVQPGEVINVKGKVKLTIEISTN